MQKKLLKIQVGKSKINTMDQRYEKKEKEYPNLMSRIEILRGDDKTQKDQIGELQKELNQYKNLFPNFQTFTNKFCNLQRAYGEVVKFQDNNQCDFQLLGIRKKRLKVLEY